MRHAGGSGGQEILSASKSLVHVQAMAKRPAEELAGELMQVGRSLCLLP